MGRAAHSLRDYSEHTFTPLPALWQVTPLPYFVQSELVEQPGKHDLEPAAVERQ